MKFKTVTATLLCALLVNAAVAGELPSIFGEQREAMQVWPLAREHLARDLLAAGADEGEEAPMQVASSDQISPGRALLFSALLPGAGEYYASAKKKAAVFLGIEAVAVGLYFTWKGEGSDIEDDFRKIADEHWEPLEYLAWRGTTKAIRNNSFTHALPCSLEIVSDEFGKCGGSEKQQYYELLGKYDQFVVGWNDRIDRTTNNPTTYTEIDSVEKVVSEFRVEYENKRGDSNKYLKRASNIAGLILVNHVISAIDAARTARSRAQGASARQIERRTRFLVTLHPGNRGSVPMLMAFKPFD